MPELAKAKCLLCLECITLPFICILECIDEKSRPIRELRVSKSYIPAVGEATIIMISRAANHKAFVSFDTLVLLSKNSALTFSESAQCKNSINLFSFKGF